MATSLDDMFKSIFSEQLTELFCGPKETWTVDYWLNRKLKISEADIENYPNAKRAAEIKSSPLYKALE